MGKSEFRRTGFVTEQHPVNISTETKSQLHQVRAMRRWANDPRNENTYNPELAQRCDAAIKILVGRKAAGKSAHRAAQKEAMLDEILNNN